MQKKEYIKTINFKTCSDDNKVIDIFIDKIESAIYHILKGQEAYDAKISTESNTVIRG